ncbi:RagB/SusD family nutrient uptake outer membrane protein [Mucilaginibacter ginsenosidivorans]|uniref:RagB/SusD family nutrient uptake outer membrane protein n=1 Tax=Mucilaginibacter ginsenosidivorans TaxID=398053 RepID=A0A5B8UUI8_9SPHI|nr:RagB/SusD family nutrient uptake outer membrane protein [Mucilaginibacter ginsenosidivorans]QEC62435.1 RagB/SusD family nutrient uptake outer membrane protein [Mucilaginibacter ginsenosidivorans]
MKSHKEIKNWLRITKWSFAILPFIFAACKKMVSVPEPVDSITTKEVFATDAQANSAIAGIYTQMINPPTTSIVFSNGATTLYPGLSADELIDFYGPADDGYFDSNSIQVAKFGYGYVNNFIWTPAYSNIYGANAIIEGIASSTSGALHDNVKKELTGEAKFIRAFCYFYLTNMFGDVPLALTVDFNRTALMYRTPQAQIYNQIIQDLKDAQTALPDDYSAGLGERVRPNKWAATALLARVYLFKGDWADAELQASAVINNSSLFSLEPMVGNVFNTNSKEAIWQLKQNNIASPYNGTVDAQTFIPYDSNTAPIYILTNSLLNSFETGDLRRKIWVDSTNYGGSTYYFPYKYTLAPSNIQPGGNIPQYYMMLRQAEQYLIRAEARVQLGENNALDDLNSIRNRAGLTSYSGTTDKTSILNAIYHERQVELFAEWGHRWFDLKRTGQANTVLGAIPLKQPWSSNSLLYPIPKTELITDPNLRQNPGY